MIYFNKNLVFLRQKENKSALEVSSLIGFTRSQWSNYENGKSYPKFLDLIEIAKYFGITESDLIHKDLQNDTFKSIETQKPKFENDINVSLELLLMQKKEISRLEKELQDFKDEKDKSLYGGSLGDPIPTYSVKLDIKEEEEYNKSLKIK